MGCALLARKVYWHINNQTLVARFIVKSLFKHSPHGIVMQLGAGRRADTSLRRRHDAGVAADRPRAQRGDGAHGDVVEAHAAETRLVGTG